MDRAQISPVALETISAQLRNRRGEIAAEWEYQLERLTRVGLVNGELDVDVFALIENAADAAERLASGESKREHHEHRPERAADPSRTVLGHALLRQAASAVWSRGRFDSLGADDIDDLHLALDAALAVAVGEEARGHARSMQAIDRVSAVALEARSTGELLQRLLQIILETTASVDTAAIMLREGDVLVTRAALGIEGEAALGTSSKIGEGFAGTIALQKRPMMVRNASQDPLVQSTLTRERGVRALYGVPLIDGERVAGVALVGSLTAYAFSEEERRLFSAMASRATSGIVQHLLREAAERRALQQQAVAELGAIALSSDDLRRIFDEATATITRTLGSSHASILQLQSDGSFVPQSSSGWGASSHSSAPIPGGRKSQAGYTIERGEPVVTEDLATETRFELAERWRLEGLVSGATVIIPCTGAEGRRWGVLSTHWRRRHAFNLDDVHFLQTIANLVASAIVRHRHEDELRRTKSLLEQTVESREQFMATVSHDLKNPLGAVMMSSALLLKTTSFDERAVFVQKNAEIIQRAAQRMNRLLHDLLDLASIQAKRLSITRGSYEPRELVSETIDAFQSIAEERGIVLVDDSRAPVGRIECDRDRLLQVLSNLVSNAIKATERSGTIAIDVRREGREVIFSVRDTGRGIPEDEAPHVFDRYWRGRTAGYRGTGLGLAIARGIIEAHGGRIWLDSRLGKGTTFYFSLPCS
jgi:signal transduction histidine kinase/putative methionine-R-sulfoxide reductase with GAF domain